MQTRVIVTVIFAWTAGRCGAAQAETDYLRALKTWELKTSEPDGGKYLPQYCIALMNMGELYRRQQRTAEAGKSLSQAVDLAKLFETEHQELYPLALSRLGGLYGESDQPERGRPLVTEALEKLEKLAPRPTAELGYAHDAMGMIELTSGNLRAGESHLRQAVALGTSSLGENDPETAMYQTNLALALVLQEQFGRAETLLRRARFVVETYGGQNDPRLGTIFAELSAAAGGQNKLAVAEDFAQEELSVITSQPAPSAAAIALAQVNLAYLYLREGKTSDAERILPGAVAAERGALANGLILADGIRRLAELRATRQSWREAENLYREALGLYELRLGPKDPKIAPVLREYADVLKRGGGSKSEVKSIEARAKAIMNSTPRA